MKKKVMNKRVGQALLALTLILLSAYLAPSPVCAEESYDIPLKSGENLIALPLTPQDPNIQSILSPIIDKVKDVWEYRPSDVDDPWKHYRPGLEEYSDLSEIGAGAGYWVDLKSDLILQVTGTPVAENTTFDLKKGWNIIGWPYQYPQEITEALSALTFGIDYNQVSRFNNVTKTQEDFLNLSGSDDFITFDPARAYYIYMLKDKTVYFYPSDFIGPEGGEVTSFDGKVKVIIPQGALNEPTAIGLTPIDPETLTPATPLDKALLSAVDCRPFGLVFNKPVSLIYTLDQAEVPGTTVELGLYDSINDEIVSTGRTTTVGVDGYTLTFSLMHFSTYAAMKSTSQQVMPIGASVKIPLPDVLTGAFSHSIPITVAPGRKGLQANLALVYRSSNPNSWVGTGFSLNTGYIVRSTRLGPPTYTDNDTFYFITDNGTTELVHLVDNLYQSKIESSFIKFFKEEDDSWRVVTKDGAILRFGQDTDSKETSEQGTFSWYLTEVVDPNGNYMDYQYTKDQGKCYPSRVDYTGNEIGVSPQNSVEFILESRDDIPSSYISGTKVATTKRLKEILVKVEGVLVWRYELGYDYSEDTNRSLLRSITQYGSDDKSFPTQNFGYQRAEDR
ncbi:MAG: hypothetical protein KKG21_06570 [Candidatus Omnitrophica bacterium]|nr:hypothetical protein [Candidatus Omnitrophota bacterium]